jgi:branched-chain amino acid aminotransferase
MFLDAQEGRCLEELGGVTLVLVHSDGTLITPHSDRILEGITRDSIPQLIEDRSLRVEHRTVTLDEWHDGVADGAIIEAFACGTAGPRRVGSRSATGLYWYRADSRRIMDTCPPLRGRRCP